MSINPKEIALMLDLASSAEEFMEAKLAARDAKMDYVQARERYLATAPEMSFNEHRELAAFELATGRSYRALQKAQAKKHNAERRMATRYRWVNKTRGV